MPTNKTKQNKKRTYSLVLLLKVVDVSVQNLNKQFHVRHRVHARVCNLERLLETFQDTLAIAVGLSRFTIFLANDHGAPPQVTAGVHGTALVRLLQKFGTMKGTLCNKGIVVIHIEARGRL